MAGFVCSSCGKLFKYKRNVVRHEREVHNLREHFVCDQPGCNARLIRRSYIVKHLTNKHHMSDYDARAHAVAARKIPVVSNKTSGYESVSDSESILDILEELDTTPRSPYHPDTELVSDGEIDNFLDIFKEIDIPSPVAVFYAA